MDEYSSSIYVAEENLLNNNCENFQYEIGNFFFEKGGEVADALVLVAKHQIRECSYREALSTCAAAEKIIHNHPWVRYYQLLAIAGLTEKGRRKEVLEVPIHQALECATIYFNEPAFYVLIQFFKSNVENLDIEKISEFEAIGRTSCIEIGLTNWDISSLRNKILDDIKKIVTNLNYEVLASPISKGNLYYLYFYISKYFSLIINFYQIRSLEHHQRIIQVYKVIAACLTLNKTSIIQAYLKICLDALKQDNFWQQKDRAKKFTLGQILPWQQNFSTPTVALQSWLEKYETRLCHDSYEQGLYVGNFRETFIHYSLKELEGDEILEELARLKRQNDKFRVAVYEHFFCGYEVRELG